jgi:hypothetical protein
MNDIKTHYEYIIQWRNPFGKWIPIVDVMHSNSFAFDVFKLYKEKFGDNVRIMRRVITVGDWEVQN